MTLFLAGIVLLIVGYYTYGRVIEKILQPDDRATPAIANRDGVDYIVLPNWKNKLIQLLNIAGVGPVIGVILGIKFGPIVFLLIPFGNIIGGSVHDFVSGMYSLRHNGCNLPKMTHAMLGNGVCGFMSVFVCIILLLVVTVFVNVPANLLDATTTQQSEALITQPAVSQVGLEEKVTETMVEQSVTDTQKDAPIVKSVKPHFWQFVGYIFLYYVLATLFPIDKIIGKIYPIFGAMLFLGTVLLGGSIVWTYFQPGASNFLSMTEAMQEVVSAQGPVIPCLFVTIACGILSGFHATQSPIVARTIQSEHQARGVFYGMMILEGIIAMIWAAGGMAIYNLMPEMLKTEPNTVLVAISEHFLGVSIGSLAIYAVIILAISTGDTALRSLRLSIAEMFHFPQKTLSNRLLITFPLILIIGGLLLWSNRNPDTFKILWNYFAWGNQVMAAGTLWACTVWLISEKRCYWVTLLPAVFMTVVVLTFILWAPGGLKLPQGLNLPLNYSYIIASVIAFLIAIWVFYRARKI